MRIAGLERIDRRIRGSALGRIIVYLAAMLSIMAIPVIVISEVKSIVSRTNVYECAFEAIFAFAAVAAIFVMQRGPDSVSVKDFGLKFDGVVTATALGAGIGLALMTALMNILRALHVYQIVAVDRHFAPLLPVLMFLFVAIAEETIFRGFIFNTIERRSGTLIALTATSITFGLAHLIDPMPGISFGEHFKAALFLSLEAGLLLNAAYLVNRTLWLNIGIHWAWNFFQGPFYGAAVSGTSDQQSYYISRLVGSPAITGGSFGPEASIPCLIIGTFVGAALLLAAIRRGQWRQNPELLLNENSA